MVVLDFSSTALSTKSTKFGEKYCARRCPFGMRITLCVMCYLCGEMFEHINWKVNKCLDVRVRGSLCKAKEDSLFVHELRWRNNMPVSLLATENNKYEMISKNTMSTSFNETILVFIDKKKWQFCEWIDRLHFSIYSFPNISTHSLRNNCMINDHDQWKRGWTYSWV